MSEDDFWELFKPKVNFLDEFAGFDGCMFETYGPEVAYVLSVHRRSPRQVWTVIECDGELYIDAGYHHVNRLGYMVTENGWADETESVKLEN